MWLFYKYLCVLECMPIYLNFVPTILTGGKLEGMTSCRCLLLAPVEGWWPTSTWKALRGNRSTDIIDEKRKVRVSPR